MSDPKQNETEEHISEPDDTPTVLSVIRGLQNGAVSAKSLSITNRRACVEHLTGEGYSIVEIAEILKVSERTVARDRQATYEANAIQRDPALVEQVVGRLVQEADTSISCMRRVARGKSTSDSVKVDAAHRCYQVLSDLIQNLQRLGYLPTAAHEIRADLTHHVGDIPDLPETQAEIERLMLISVETGNGQVPPELVELKRKAEAAGLAIDVEAVSLTLSDKEVNHETSE